MEYCETLEEADFPSTGLEDIESLKGGRRNLFDEKSTVENVNEDDMILQDSLLNLPFLSTQEVSCLDIDTQKTPQIQKQGLQEESSQIQKHEIPKSFHSNKLKLAKYVLPDAQATGEKRQEVMVNETSMFRGRETKTFDSIKSKLVKKNDGIAECMKEKPIHELKGKSVDFKGGHPTAKRQQIKKAMEGEKNVPKTRGKKTDADKQDIKKPHKKEPNDKEETAIYASPISFIPPPIDTESEKRQGKPSNFLVSPFYQRKVILDEPVSEEGKKIVEYIWSKNTPEGDIVFDRKKGFGIEGVYFLSLYPEIEVASTIIDLWTLVLNNEEQHRDKLSGDGNVYCHTVMMMESFIDYLERKKYQNCYDLILAEPKLVKFPWKTTYNSHDCGVFVMRHMETYLGKGIFFKEFKKEGPGQKVQLNMLRAKYMVKILLMSFNEKKKTLLKQAQAYIKMKPKSFMVLTGNDVRVDEELLKRFNETVIKTIDV
ncbi:ulp1 protease family, C-terminal catalytic domain-containing protein [Tanacetum coccineum]